MHTKKNNLLDAYHISFIVAITFARMPHRITWIDQRPRNETAAKATIVELSYLNAYDVVGLTYIVDMAIKSVVPHENWWYMGCSSCKRTAGRVGHEYSCPRCPSIAAELR